LNSFTTHLVLAQDAAIDLQLHTIYSDGTWTPEQLVDYLVSERFGLAAITDHDRVDTVASLQLHELVALLKKHGYGTGEPSAGKLVTDAGLTP
jgi:histidinol phosphatase-like PHP family hydrolase